MFDITCVLFAGGKSSRMGRDKALLPFGGSDSLARFQYDRLSRLFRHVCISAKSAARFGFEADIIEDAGADGLFAPTAGFAALFRQLSDERLFVMSVDTPFVGEEEIRRLVEADDASLDAVIAESPSGSHPMCGIYRRSLAPAFERMLEEQSHRLGMLLANSRTRYVYFEDDAPFANLNHPHEYEAALKKLHP